MLNQRLSDLRFQKLFGVGLPADAKPKFVLLDEVHTYSGVTGAQTALVLRRWRNLLRTPLKFIGLSATLLEAESFFAQLCGLRARAVDEIRPLDSELKREGAEYQLAIRGNPASQAQLLSTTIQSVMLLQRMQDQRNLKRSAAAVRYAHFRFYRQFGSY